MDLFQEYLQETAENQCFFFFFLMGFPVLNLPIMQFWESDLC